MGSTWGIEDPRLDLRGDLTWLRPTAEVRSAQRVG